MAQGHIDPAGTTNQTIVDQVNGTGPYKLEAWNRGVRRHDGRATTTTGATRPRTRSSSSAGARRRAQRLVELQSGTVDGIDNVGTDRLRDRLERPGPAAQARDGLNVIYFGMNNTYAPFDNEKVRQAIAMGIDRQRIVDNFYPAGLRGRRPTSRRAPSRTAAPATPWYEFDADRGQGAAGRGRLPERLQDQDPVPRRRRAATCLTRTSSPQDIQAQLKANLSIDATIDIQESGTLHRQRQRRQARWDPHARLGRRLSRTSPTSSTTTSAPAPRRSSASKFDDITSALDEGAAGARRRGRKPAYEKANNAIKAARPDGADRARRSAVAYRADVKDAHSSPLGNEKFAVMTPGDRPQFVWMQNGEPAGLYCADETDGEALRACQQMSEPLYSYEIGGTAAVPALATECAPNAELTHWTCTLRDGVTFHDGATLDANDVVTSYAVQWDAEHPLHKGRTGRSRTSRACSVGSSTRRRRRRPS